MAVVMRGWSKTASTALKLATAERIIGYQFKNIDKLYEALDQTERRIALPNGKKLRLRPRNSRLALVGDALGVLHMAQGWYSTNLTGVEWAEIHMSTLSNERLGGVGFKLGLNECAIAKEITRPYDMATTIEALVAAVHMDGASQEQCHKVYARFGLQHKLLHPPERLWIWNKVSSRLRLPEKFFIGHHFKLQDGIFQTQLKRFPAQKKKKKRKAGLWARTKWLWQSTTRLWLPREETQKELVSQRRRLRRAASRSATRPPETRSVDPLAGRTQPTVTRTTNPPLDVATSETEAVGQVSSGRCADDEQAVPSEQMADKGRAGEEQGAEASTSEVPTLSKTRKRPPQPDRPREESSTDQLRPAATGSQDSKTASKDGSAPNPPSKDVAATGAGLEVEHHSHETLQADPAEVTEEDHSEESLIQMTKDLAEEAQALLAAARKFRGKSTEEDKLKLLELQNRRKEVLDKRSRLLNPRCRSEA